MAIEIFFQELAQYHAREAINVDRGKATLLHETAIKQLVGGDMDAYQATFERIVELNQQGITGIGEINAWLQTELIPLINSRLEEKGIALPPEQFLEIFRGFRSENTPERTRNRPVESGPLNQEQRRLVLASEQYRAAIARLRLIDTQDEMGLTFSAAVDQIYTPEEIGAERKLFIYRTVNGSFNKAREKLESGLQFMTGKVDIDEIVMPLSEDELEKYNFAPKMLDLFRSISNAPAYQGLNLAQIVDLTHKLERKLITCSHESAVAHKFSEVEIYFLALQISRHGDDLLTQPDLSYTDQVLSDMGDDNYLSLKPGEIDQIKQNILQKLMDYREMIGQKREDFFEAQSDIGKFFFGVVMSKWNSEGRLRDLLELPED